MTGPPLIQQLGFPKNVKNACAKMQWEFFFNVKNVVQQEIIAEMIYSEGELYVFVPF